MAEQGLYSGQIFGGKYQLGKLIGKGGFGTVYRAQHLDLNRQQAIKVLPEHYFHDQKFRDRFMREAQIVANLDNTNIVHIDDVGVDDSRPFLVMPYIRGGTLEDILKKLQPFLNLKQASAYLEDICNALEYAHQKGVAHLDLKPRNLLVHEDGRLMLSDFGLAHFTKQGTISGGTSLNHGTPRYMAPEHLNGQPAKCSDLFSVGVILAEMLLGMHIFDGQLPADCPRPQLKLRTDLPRGLENVLAKALAKNPLQRYQTASELFEDFLYVTGSAPKSPSLLEDHTGPSTRKIKAVPPPTTPSILRSVPKVPAGRSFIYVEDGNNPGQFYELDQQEIGIGRSRENEIFLDDAAVSRIHASIVLLRNGQYALRDDDSANGTKLNGKFIDSQRDYPLDDRDHIMCGEQVLVFMVNGRQIQSVPTAKMQVGIRVERGNEPGSSYELVKQSTSIGSNAACIIYFDDPYMESWHASIIHQGNGVYVLKHEHSTNGTQLNGVLIKKFQQYTLKDGDQIQFGKHVVTFYQH